MKLQKKYPIEDALEKLIRELTLFVRNGRKFLFNIPKNKMDKYIYALDIIAWTTLTVSIVLRIAR